MTAAPSPSPLRVTHNVRTCYVLPPASTSCFSSHVPDTRTIRIPADAFPLSFFFFPFAFSPLLVNTLSLRGIIIISPLGAHSPFFFPCSTAFHGWSIHTNHYTMSRAGFWSRAGPGRWASRRGCCKAGVRQSPEPREHTHTDTGTEETPDFSPNSLSKLL